MALCLSVCQGDEGTCSFYDKNLAGVEDLKDSFEEVIEVFGPDNNLSLSISLNTSGAVFYQGGEEIGSLRYEKAYYYLFDPDGNLIWKMMAHDTEVVVLDSESVCELSIVRRRDQVEFIDRGGKALFHIYEKGDVVSLYRVSGDTEGPDELIAAATPTDEGILVSDDMGDIRYLTNSVISPLGLVTIMLPEYDIIERSALMIMVK